MGMKRGPYKSRVSVILRFWEKVDKQGPGGCWLWTASKDQHGYGRITAIHGQPPVKAHRLSWVFANGEIPDGAMVLHRCDVPSCVNPEHLFLGSQKDNMSDARAKGRTRLPAPLSGERHHNAKLTADQAREIFSLSKSGASSSALSKRFGVDRAVIANIAKRRSYTAATEALV